MKNLKDIILEKLKIDDIVLSKEEFPANGTINDMIEFLEDAGFKKVSTSPNWANSFEKYKKYKSKCYAVSRGTVTYIEIMDRSNSMFKNKLFYIKLDSTYKYNKDKYNIFDDITIAERGSDSKHIPKEEFLKELSKIL